MDIAASAGVNYFDESMNPTINQGKAAEALDMYREIIKFGPPGAEAMDIGTTIQRWQSGSDVMSVWWIDLAEFTVQQQGVELAEDQRGAIVPGWQNDDGSITNRAISLWCRTASVPKNLPEDVKEAAFYFIYRMSHPDYSNDIVADEYCGSDPFGKTHYGTRRRSSTFRPIRSAAPTTSCGRPMQASSRASTRPRTTWTRGWPTWRSAIRSSSGRVRRSTRRPRAQHLEGDLRQADQPAGPWTRQPRNG